jgi:hypothetical protein
MPSAMMPSQMVPTTVSKLMPVGVGGSGYMQTPGYQPAAAYDLRTHSKIQRGFVGIRVAYPHSSLQALSALPKVTKALYAGPQISYAPTADAGIAPRTPPAAAREREKCQ